jgi:xylulokinase
VSLSTTRADLTRSVFEGIALNARWMKETVERFVRRSVPGGFAELNFVGGGATSALWCQTMADVLGPTGTSTTASVGGQGTGTGPARVKGWGSDV